MVILVALVFLVFGVSFMLQEEREEYQKYKDFCENRPDFCYCSWIQCEFKTLWSSTDGFSEDTRELCKLAIELKDKKTIFRVGCEE